MRATTLPLFVLLFAGLCQGQDRGNKASYVVMEPTPQITIAKGKPKNAEIRFRVKKGFHINSNKPTSDLLIPTEIKLEAVKGLNFGKVVYPEGKELSLAFAPGEKLSIYQDEVAVTVPVSAQRSAKSGAYKVKGALSYQACNDNSCFPPKTVPLEINVLIR